MMEKKGEKKNISFISSQFHFTWFQIQNSQQLMSDRGVKQVASNLFTSVPFSCLIRSNRMKKKALKAATAAKERASNEKRV